MHGNWGEWSTYSRCSAYCGEGTQLRTRQCNNPPPSQGGLSCLLTGSDTQRAAEEKQTSPCISKNVCEGKGMIRLEF